MLRLVILYHDDTAEPVAVDAFHRAIGFATGAAKDFDGTVCAWGLDGEKCRELLLRERAHWAATKRQEG